MITFLWAALCIASAWMAGIAWYVQFVHYPAFRFVDPARWAEFHRFHCNWTGPVVGVGIGVQVVCTVGVVILATKQLIWPAYFSVLLLGCTVGWTALVSGPLHRHFMHEFSEDQLQKLLWTNWIRAIFWVVQACVAAAIAFR
jgi:hypothetical protein